MKHPQHGSTLIMTLILLLMVTVLGTMAVRQAFTTLNVATNTQASVLLFQSSDAPLYRLAAGGLSSSSGLATSLLGYALLNQGKEVVFCFRSQSSSTLFSTATTSLLTWDDAQTDTTYSGTTGFCDVTSSSDFASSRKAQITQVAVIANPTTSTIDTTPFSTTALGTDAESSTSTTTNLYRVYSTSFIPALSSATTTEIAACLKRPNEAPLSGSLTTVSSCLKALNVPFNTQIQDFKLDTCTVSTGSTITVCS